MTEKNLLESRMVSAAEDAAKAIINAYENNNICNLKEYILSLIRNCFIYYDEDSHHAYQQMMQVLYKYKVYLPSELFNPDLFDKNYKWLSYLRLIYIENIRRNIAS